MGSGKDDQNLLQIDLVMLVNPKVHFYIDSKGCYNLDAQGVKSSEISKFDKIADFIIQSKCIFNSCRDKPIKIYVCTSKNIKERIRRFVNSCKLMGTFKNTVGYGTLFNFCTDLDVIQIVDILQDVIEEQLQMKLERQIDDTKISRNGRLDKNEIKITKLHDESIYNRLLRLAYELVNLKSLNLFNQINRDDEIWNKFENVRYLKENVQKLKN